MLIQKACERSQAFFLRACQAPRQRRMCFLWPAWHDARMASKNGFFTNFARHTVDATGHPLAFAVAFLTVLVWAVSGPMFGYSETWQLVINTGTTIITFLMVFLIQNGQNRDTRALQLKLDELLRVTKGAHTGLLDLEELSDDELCKIQSVYEKIAAQSRKANVDDTNVPHIEFPEGFNPSPRKPKRYSKRPRKKKA